MSKKQSQYNKSRNKINNQDLGGFTLAEILVVVAALAFINAITSSAFYFFYRGTLLNEAVRQTFSLLQEARSNTLSSKDFSQYGVHFEEQKVVLFKGAIFTEPNSNNKEVKISSPVEIYNISLNGGGSNVVFQKLTGKTNEYGTISFQSPEISGCLPGASSMTKIITIQSSGSFSY